MSIAQPRTPNRSVLGESWVVASTVSIKDDEADSLPTNDPASPTLGPGKEKHVDIAEPANDSPKPNRDQNHTQLSESLTSSTSSWSMSGPELVMPSIYEVPISEASWVAPRMRSTDSKSPHMRKRRKITPSGKQAQQSKSTTEASNAGSSASGHHSKRPDVIKKLSSLYHGQRALLRSAINTFLIALIMHLLILPELIYQAQDLCTFPSIKATYPASCVPLHPRDLPSNPFHSISTPLSPEETIIAAQNTLQAIFTSTLSTLTPLSQTLKDSESTVSTLQTTLQSTLPDARNALALEFQGSDAALRAATWEFDSLRADLRSAVDSLLASPLALESGGPTSIARDTRLAAQLRRRAEYLDRLRAQLRNKAESLGGRFATLDDHLEAVDSIVSREARRASMLEGNKNRPADTSEGLLHSLSSYARFSTRLFGARSSSSSSSSSHDQSTNPSSSASSSTDPAQQRTSTLALLRLAATQHRAVADEVARLARALRDEQRARLGPTW